MSRILVAEDSVTQAEELRLLLMKLGHEVQLCADGAAALEAVGRQPPDLVLTDLEMPRLNGLELVEALREHHPAVPVVLMTAFGNEEIAVQALRRGAASYVPKKRLLGDLEETLSAVLGLSKTDRDQRRLQEHLTETESRFCLDNDPELAITIVAHVQDAMAQMHMADENDRLRVGVALEEAIHNAIFHGNLELSGEEIQNAYSLEDGGSSYYQFLAQRRRQTPYCDRRVHIGTRISRQEAVCIVRDEGPGFDHMSLPPPDEPASLDAAHNRGMLLINSFMDEVRFNATGNEITMIKWAAPAEY